MDRLEAVFPVSSMRKWLVWGWREGASMACVIDRVADEAGLAVNRSIRPGAFDPHGLHVVSPKRSISISPYSLGTDAKGWLATHFRPVSDALFDGATDEKALQIFAKLRQGRNVKADIEVRALKLDQSKMARTMTIRARSLSKKSDWHTVK